MNGSVLLYLPSRFLLFSTIFRRKKVMRIKISSQLRSSLLLLALSLVSLCLSLRLFFIIRRSLREDGEGPWKNIESQFYREYAFDQDIYPGFLPIVSGNPVEMILEESVHYSIDNVESQEEWIYTSPFGTGSYRPDGDYTSTFATMFHQLHCLRMFRTHITNPAAHIGHSRHCLNYLRQNALCAADTTLEPGDFTQRNFTIERQGSSRTCQDWRIVYSELQKNWVEWYRFMAASNISISEVEKASERGV